MANTSWMDEEEPLAHKIVELPENEKLSFLSGLCAGYLRLQKEIAKKEEELKELNKQLWKVSNFDIPLMMRDIGMSEFKLYNGMKVEVKPYYVGKITDDKAYEWLIDNNHGDIIKAEIVIPYDAANEEQKHELQVMLKENNVQYGEKLGVHHMTLGAFIKEQEQLGTPLDEKLFNVFSGFKTYIK